MTFDLGQTELSYEETELFQLFYRVLKIFTLNTQIFNFLCLALSSMETIDFNFNPYSNGENSFLGFQEIDKSGQVFTFQFSPFQVFCQLFSII